MFCLSFYVVLLKENVVVETAVAACVMIGSSDLFNETSANGCVAINSNAVNDRRTTIINFTKN
jgi:hypothetical protein